MLFFVEDLGEVLEDFFGDTFIGDFIGDTFFEVFGGDFIGDTDFLGESFGVKDRRFLTLFNFSSLDLGVDAKDLLVDCVDAPVLGGGVLTSELACASPPSQSSASSHSSILDLERRRKPDGS